MEIVFSVGIFIVIALLALEGWLFLQLATQQGRLLARLAALEARVAHPNGPEARQGLAVGSPAPPFSLADLGGRERTLAEFIGQPLLLVFFSPRCSYCAQMAPRLGELPPDRPRVLLVSKGEVDEHRRMAVEHGWGCEVLLQKDAEISKAYQATGTPTGYLLDDHGRIASPLTIGADALLELASSVRTAAHHIENGHDHDLTADALREKERAVAARASAVGLAVRESRLNRRGLSAGAIAPEFSLPDLSGLQRSLRDYRGRRVLLVFSDPECGPCQALAPDLVEVHRRRQRENLEIVMVSRRDPEANRAKAEKHGINFPILLQQGWEVSKLYGIFGTPVGYLIDEQGVIARDVAIGGDAIVRLVGVYSPVAQH